MVQDISSSPLPNIHPTPAQPVASQDSGLLPTPTALPNDPTHIIEAHEVEVDGDVGAVPQESVGLGGESSFIPPVQPVAPPTLPSASDDVVALPEVHVTEEPVVAPAADASVEQESDTTPAPQLVVDEIASSQETSDFPSREPASDEVSVLEESTGKDGEKSPLDILEEILAGAEAEKNQADEEKKKKEQEEAAFQAQLDAKKAEYKSQVDVRLMESKQAVQEAKQYREDVDKQLIEQGKLDPKATDQSDEFEIRQLEHQKPE